MAIELDIQRFRDAPSRSERSFLKRLSGPILDIGCGPGRAAAYLRQRDVPALGLDANAGLVALARSNGALCVHQNAFEPVPFEGRWQQVLLLDGNIGIGGDPAKLLERLRRILIPGGRALIEVERNGTCRQMIVREHVSGRIGEPFAWATLTMSGLDELIAGHGWRCEYVHEIDDRLIVELERLA
ncbi:MAG: SAM-dependent methyltransferase [Ilumatobacter sp.]|jgi:SAM-dependent methyltransferase